MQKKVMVVDDEKDVAKSIELNLKRFNDDIYIMYAESGEKCLEFLTNNKIPDLIILDIMMPGLNGWEVFNTIKENKGWKHIPIIFLTARRDKTAANAGQFLADDYIEKPYDIDDFRTRVEKILYTKK